MMDEHPSPSARQALAGVRIALVPLGCPKNDVDAEYMLGLLGRAGAKVVEDAAEADVILVNTCAFIEPAVEEAISVLLDATEAAAAIGAVVVATGCLAGRYGQALLDELPEVAAFAGPGAVPDIVRVVRGALDGRRVLAAPPPSFVGSADLPRGRLVPPWRAWVKVADGCSHACTFCTIPALRGPFRSRPPEDIAAEVKRLVDEGVREISLVAQDTSSYGRDLGLEEGLARLLEKLAVVVEDSAWLRVQYLHPDVITSATVGALSGLKPVVPYFDLPFQHAASSVLKSMGRSGSGEGYLQLVADLRRSRPHAAVRATFIVGFPGETEEDFQTLMDFLAAAQPDHTAIFPYWPEEGTPAARLASLLPDELVRDRQAALMEVAAEAAQARSEALIGDTVEVLVEGKDQTGQALGRSFRDAPEVDGTFHLALADAIPAGTVVVARVTGAEQNDLYGRLVRDCRQRPCGPAGRPCPDSDIAPPSNP